MQTYQTQCPQCGKLYVEGAWVDPDDPERICPYCLISDSEFDPNWFLFNPCPFPVWTEERRRVHQAREQHLLPIKVPGDNQDYDKKLCKGIVNRRRSVRFEWLTRDVRSAAFRNDLGEGRGGEDE